MKIVDDRSRGDYELKAVEASLIEERGALNNEELGLSSLIMPLRRKSCREMP